MYGRGVERVLSVLCSCSILLLAYIFNICRQVQHQLNAFSLLNGSGNREGMGSREGNGHRFSRMQLVNLRPSFNMKLINTEQVIRKREYGPKWNFRWARGKASCRIRRLLNMNKGMCHDNIRQMETGDVYYKNNIAVNIPVCNPSSINRKEGVILHHCVTKDPGFCLLTETWVRE